MIPDCSDVRYGVFISPHGIAGRLALTCDPPVGGVALPRAFRAGFGLFEMGEIDIVEGDIENWIVSGFQ